MNAERGMVFCRAMREASRLAREAADELRVCMAVLDADDPVEHEVWRRVMDDVTMLSTIASGLDDAVRGRDE